MFVFCLLTKFINGNIFLISSSLCNICYFFINPFLVKVTISGATIFLFFFLVAGSESRRSALSTVSALVNCWLRRSTGYSCCRNLSLSSKRYSRFHSCFVLIMIPCRSLKDQFYIIFDLFWRIDSLIFHSMHLATDLSESTYPRLLGSCWQLPYLQIIANCLLNTLNTNL